MQKKALGYIGVPIGLGSGRKGTEHTPNLFRKEGFLRMIGEMVPCEDFGDIPVYASCEGASSCTAESVAVPCEDFGKIEINRAKHLDVVLDMANNLRDKVSSVIADGYLPLVVGGDHSIGLGSCSGMAMRYDNPGVIWFDAHGDFNTEETTPSGNIHGMPCAALMGWCKSPLNDVASVKIPPQNFYWVGARSLDPGELKLAQEHRLHIFSSDEVNSRGMDAVMRDVVRGLSSSGIDSVHLSVDIDAMDPSIVCGTGTKVPAGMDDDQFRIFIDEVFASLNIVSIDFVEYNSALDDERHSTLEWCRNAINLIASKLR